MDTTTLDPPDTRPPEHQPTPTPPTDRTNPAHWFAGRLQAVLDDLGDPASVPMFSLSTGEISETVTELLDALPRIEALVLALVAHGDRTDVAADSGAVSTAAWLRTLRPSLSGPQARRMVRLAGDLEAEELTPVRLALARGLVTLDQAKVVRDAVRNLPAEVDPAQRRRAAAHLVAEAQSFDAGALKRLARHLMDVVDPDGADARLGERLDRDEAEAARQTSFTIRHGDDGISRGEFVVPTLQGLVLEQMLDALAGPQRPDPIPRHDEAGVRRARAEIMGDAFVELIDRIPTRKLPKVGGSGVTVVVTVSLETLEGRLGAAGVLGSDHQVSAGTARRLAATHGVIPAVLGGESRVLDLGRRRRLHDGHQRLALAVEQDGLCAIADCDRPVSWCEAAHLTAWSEGGDTSTDNAALLCTRHHDLSERATLDLVRLPRGGLVLRRRE